MYKKKIKFKKTKLIHKRKSKKNIWKYYIIGLSILLILFINYSLIFFSRKSPKITNLSNKINSDESGKIYWNNETDLGVGKIRKEINEIINKQISFENQTNYIKSENPLISLVITLYNQEKYIKLIYSCIQKQEMKDIEIIFVDDFSTDNTSKIVNSLMEKDKRIIYLKNDVNRKTFYSRNKGILNSSGKYILIIDPDDLLLNNILIKAYATAIKYDLDIVQYYFMIGNYGSHYVWKRLKYKNGILRGNSEVRKLFYYGITRNICDKLVRREVYIKSIKFMKKEFYNEDYHVNDDDTAFFGLVHVAESHGFLEQVGYLYVLKPGVPSHSIVDIKRVDNFFRSVFNNLKYFYVQSDDNSLEKNTMAYNYFKRMALGSIKKIDQLNGGFDFILDVLNLYLNCSYFDDSKKNKIYNFRTKIMEQQKKVKGLK